jgi:hypothetical protein
MTHHDKKSKRRGPTSTAADGIVDQQTSRQVAEAAEPQNLPREVDAARGSGAPDNGPSPSSSGLAADDPDAGDMRRKAYERGATLVSDTD